MTKKSINVMVSHWACTKKRIGDRKENHGRRHGKRKGQEEDKDQRS